MVFFVATKKPITLWLSLNSCPHLVHFSPGLLALICVNAFYKLAKQTAHSVYALWALNPYYTLLYASPIKRLIRLFI